MIVAVPAVIPVTTPVELTVATAGDEEVQAPEVDGVPLPLNCVVEPMHTESVPVITGIGLTVTVTVVSQPALFV